MEPDALCGWDWGRLAPGPTSAASPCLQQVSFPPSLTFITWRLGVGVQLLVALSNKNRDSEISQGLWMNVSNVLSERQPHYHRYFVIWLRATGPGRCHSDSESPWASRSPPELWQKRKWEASSNMLNIQNMDIKHYKHWAQTGLMSTKTLKKANWRGPSLEQLLSQYCNIWYMKW